MSDKYAVIYGITIQKGDIVEIKFKKLEEILSYYRDLGYRANDVINGLALGEHMGSMTSGGFFHVENVRAGGGNLLNTAPKQKGYRAKDNQLDEITINDHNNADYDYFTINESIIESITVREDVSENVFSDKFQISLVKIDGLLLINGVPLTPKDKDIIEILEKTVADMSIRSMFEESKEEF